MENLIINTKNLIVNEKKKNLEIKIDLDKEEDMENMDFFNNEKYNISICSKKKVIHVQFKINTKFVSDIILDYKNKEYKYTNIPYNGILLNLILDYNNFIKIKPKFKNESGTINIWDIELLNPNYISKNITWDSIYIINLERRLDRKIIMEQRLKDQQITNYKFISAIDGKKRDIIKKYDDLVKNKKTRIVNSGHYACLLSHIKIIEQAKSENLNSVMILEDDIIFNDNFINKINNIILPEYDILYIGGITDELKFFPEGWGKSLEIMGAYAYIVKSHMYDVILDLVASKKYCIDVAFNEFIIKKYNVYILDDLIKTNLDTSDTSDKNKILIKLLDYTWVKPIIL